MRRLSERGFTILELMVTIAIGAILVGVAAPFFGDFLANSRIRQGANVLQGAALFAQNEAIKRNGTVQLSVDGATLQVTDTTQVPSAMLSQQALPADVAASAVIRFGSQGRPVPFGDSQTVQLALGGAPCAKPHRCPVLQVEAGGAVRLCKDLATCQ